MKLLCARHSGGTRDANRQTSILRKQLQRLEDRSFATYKARMETSLRLARRGRAWNTSAVAFATSTTVASVGTLNHPDLYGENGATLLACVSILTLVASLVTSNLNYSGRSHKAFQNYREIQRLSAAVERLKDSDSISPEEVSKCFSRYDELLDDSENHTPGDHLRQNGQRLSRAVLAEDFVTFSPYASLLIPAALAVPLLIVVTPW